MKFFKRFFVFAFLCFFIFSLSSAEEKGPLTEEDVKTIKLKIIELLEKAKTETSSAYKKLIGKKHEEASKNIDNAIETLEEAIKATNEISNHQLESDIETLKSRLEQAKGKNLLFYFVNKNEATQLHF